MGQGRLLKYQQARFFPCLVCGVDSKPVLLFFFWLVGASVIGFICILLWGVATGKFKKCEERSDAALKAEHQE